MKLLFLCALMITLHGGGVLAVRDTEDKSHLVIDANMTAIHTCPQFGHKAVNDGCYFEYVRHQDGNGKEKVRCTGNVELIRQLHLTTPLGLDVNGPWAAMLMDGSKTIETRRYELDTPFMGKPIAMLDARNFPALVKALNREWSSDYCILGELTFDQNIEYTTDANFADQFEKDPETKLFGGHRVPCSLNTYATAFGQSEMVGWHVKQGSVRPIQVDSPLPTQSRDVLDAVGLWGQAKKELCFLPSNDNPRAPDNLGRAYAAGSSPVQPYSNLYQCMSNEHIPELDGSVRCLGTVKIEPVP